MIYVVIVLSLFRVDMLAFVNALIRVQLNQHASAAPLPSAKIHGLMLDVEASVRFLNEHACLVYLAFWRAKM